MSLKIISGHTTLEITRVEYNVDEKSFQGFIDGYTEPTIETVSYTHLDVYKRQCINCTSTSIISCT